MRPCGFVFPADAKRIDNHSHLHFNGRMYVCICKAITDHEIRDAVDGGARTLADLSKTLGIATGCGQCACEVEQILEDARPLAPVLYYSAA